MPTEYRFACALRNGMHARPASMLAEIVRRFASEVTLTKQPDGGLTRDELIAVRFVPLLPGQARQL